MRRASLPLEYFQSYDLCFWLVHQWPRLDWVCDCIILFICLGNTSENYFPSIPLIRDICHWRVSWLQQGYRWNLCQALDERNIFCNHYVLGIGYVVFNFDRGKWWLLSFNFCFGYSCYLHFDGDNLSYCYRTSIQSVWWAIRRRAWWFQIRDFWYVWENRTPSQENFYSKR